ncbi:peroxisomal acyl-coenzyme A oxidase 2 isoform X1 [Bubalus bubalis]|uniref:peroxisomal acyl-coenzyme A oxidase 2 isoform X1 n=2 Tax=Bubalus bubalis TaxID=89462 RepID=UPI001E1B66A6|nr:peroxisomal acyl-coenzyme A oxidase 2 isoform X1 [Bubalus bubalis]XP_006041429.2 peroxisomal acyl-coenzyme A oxidase 2 isoform X1 [Bubalus bubalis]XP_006041430.2 peroxisomal acyl-coenzyme A oxidase 2 isoform X1 [Bubalus bubalis]XP_025128473.2 peroxisomal acyl-coenzyme A oxidase 2 isoform X1 [Bubalus bubalis]XP_025128475.2 peroxisomal acyl-coenzyme A oxidase 2 isoform X1 [Bubalus bubalis]XP_044789901.2 peroxisomal acyl-coenzyme A oxidase 2 isoform X1 [Bubalus bubalis]
MAGSPVHRVSAGDAWSRSMHPDIESERHSQSFNVEELTNILDGGAQKTALRRKVESIIHSEPELSLKDNYFMTQNERYEAAVKKKFHILMLAERLGWSEGSHELQYASRSVSGDLGFMIHYIFQKTIRSLGSEEQIAKWDPLCSKFQILGTYAQTEMGHGTYLQGLETEATYDAATQEFVVHSPTMTAIKWWPGDLGRSATHALVQAQLICSGARQGMHAFIVPIRSLNDHSPLPGITIGDIGPKMDFEHTDNGFLKLDHVRIPRENMLNRFAQVLPDGTYVKLGVPKSNYLSMVVVRVDVLLGEVLPLLQKACTIAVRYAVIRRQSRLRPRQGAPRGATAAGAPSVPQCLPRSQPSARVGCQEHTDPEAKVLDYQTQQQKLFPPLAMAYAFHFVANNLLEFFRHSYSFILDGDFALLPELHALSAGLKAMLSDFCTQGVEQCRRACGGHGYSKLSGLPSLLTRVTASCTYEGENTVLYLQTARFLIKSYLNTQKSPGSASKGSLPQSVAYLTAPDLARCPAQTAADFLHPELYTTAWAHVAVRLIKDSVHHLQTLRQAGADEHDAWNQTTVIHVQATKAHLYYVTVKIFTESLQKLESQPAIQQVLKRLSDLYALHGILTNAGDFLHDGFLSGAQIDMARKAYLDLLPFIRKDAILLTDAFDFTDQCLNSALGCYDGHAYERLFQWAQKSPTNTEGNPAYEKYIRPLLQGRRARL